MALTDVLPLQENFSGEYDFCVRFPNKEKITKAVPYCYSEILKKWFVLKKASCPVIITANIRSDQLRDFELRVWLEFEKSSETVKKCINCKGANADGINGILRCESHGTAYYFIWNRHFAAVNLASMTTSGRFDETFKEHANFTFKCPSSHVDTKTRGQLKFIIALVDLRRDMEVGRCTVGLKVCSCPGRDMGTDEKRGTNELPKGKKGRRRQSPSYEPYPVRRSRVNNKTHCLNDVPEDYPCEDDVDSIKFTIQENHRFTPEHMPTIVSNMKEVIEKYFNGTADKINLDIVEYIFDHNRRIPNEAPLTKRSCAVPRTYGNTKILAKV